MYKTKTSKILIMQILVWDYINKVHFNFLSLRGVGFIVVLMKLIHQIYKHNLYNSKSQMIVGEGDDGKLGHSSRLSCDKPRLIEALKSKRVRDIACGSSHSAAITSAGELYTWGSGMSFAALFIMNVMINILNEEVKMKH